MAMPAAQSNLVPEVEDFDRLLARLQATTERKQALWGSVPAFDYDAWLVEHGPADPDELAEMETILAEREIERQRSLEIDAQAPCG
jgi:hypothetical protein